MPDLSEKTAGTIFVWVAGPERQEIESWQSAAASGTRLGQAAPSAGGVTRGESWKRFRKEHLQNVFGVIAPTPPLPAGAVTAGSILLCRVAVCLHFGGNILGQPGWRCLGWSHPFICLWSCHRNHRSARASLNRGPKSVIEQYLRAEEMRWQLIRSEVPAVLGGLDRGTPPWSTTQLELFVINIAA